ncbi:MAG: DNA replication/repair protein RecF [Chloroflexi bacterium]|nr:DNA replication/repair protein RecF [Chloroflexota bacterium]MBT7081350.1 DNA replication/repair protein RecF [Chloroflexota bacterium]MBT7290658.1 DNA replication/repair protein RecF [Chloroflexota bacterium]
MYISHLSLNNFRNYTAQEIDLPSGPIVLCGDNAQGKTNFLEAIYLLATSKSPWASTDRELVNWLSTDDVLQYTRLGAQVSGGSGDAQVEIVLTTQSGASDQEQARYLKHIKVNGVARRATDLIGIIRVVMFDPHDTEIVGGSPSLRRRYMDATNSQVDPVYLRNLQQYGKVIGQRNHLLRMIKENRASANELEFWNSQLVEAGSYIIDKRLSAIASIDSIACDIHRQLTDGTESLKTIYMPSVNQIPGKDTSQAFSQALRDAQREEIARGISVVGPHRDDLRFIAGDVDMYVYGSRGQHRTVALSIKLAQGRYIQKISGDSPILLLDDVLSELDSERRRHLLKAVLNYDQAVITATDWDHFDADFLSKASRFKVSGGSLEST